MKQAPEQKQWPMNHCLAEIGIRHPEFRKRAIGIGERLAVLIDNPHHLAARLPMHRSGSPRWFAGARRRNAHEGLERTLKWS
jgi:hypothetical protein